MRNSACGKQLLSLLFPDRCIFCSRVLGFVKNNFYICPHCAKELVFLDEVPVCRICGAPLSAGEKICCTCQSHLRSFDRAVSCFSYADGPREVILQFKFGGRRDLCRPFAAMLSRRIKPFMQVAPFDLILCTPLSTESLRKRGYNQAALLAHQLAAELNLPFIKDAFCKVTETPKQSTLSFAARIQNVKNVFRLVLPADAVRGKRILLIDDVLTTGATADALSKLLQKAGAQYILVATVATTPSKGQKQLSQEDVAAITF